MHQASYRRRQHRALVRETRLRELGYDTYDAYLRSPAWRDVRERYRASDLPQVCMCGDTKVDLHHTTYDHVGRERLEDLVPLCRACHVQAHVLEAQGVIELDLKGFYYDPERAAANALREDARKAQAALDRESGMDHREAVNHVRAVRRTARGPQMRRPYAERTPPPVVVRTRWLRGG